MADKSIENNQEVMTRVRKVLASKGKTQKELAAYLDVPAANVSKWIRTGHLPVRHWDKFTEFLGYTWQYMLGEETYDQMLYRMHLQQAQKELIEQNTKQTAVEQSDGENAAQTVNDLAKRFKINVQPVIAVGNEVPADAVLIPEYHVKFCCGNGISQDAAPQFEVVKDRLPAFYRHSWFSTKGINPSDCIRIQVEGDSMTPLIQPGDFVLIDTSNDARTKRVNGEIYAFVCDEQLMIKRLIFNENRSITLIGDNPRYPAITMTEQEAETALIIVGRVVERSGAL